MHLFAVRLNNITGCPKKVANRIMMEDQIFGPKSSLLTYFDKRPQPSGNLFNLVDTVLKVGIEKAKKDVEEEGVDIIEKFLVEKESVILRLSDFAEQVFNRIHPKSVASVQFQVGKYKVHKELHLSVWNLTLSRSLRHRPTLWTGAEVKTTKHAC